MNTETLEKKLNALHPIYNNNDGLNIILVTIAQILIEILKELEDQH